VLRDVPRRRGGGGPCSCGGLAFAGQPFVEPACLVNDARHGMQRVKRGGEYLGRPQTRPGQFSRSIDGLRHTANIEALSSVLGRANLATSR